MEIGCRERAHFGERIAVAIPTGMDFDPHMARRRIWNARSTSSNGPFALVTCIARIWDIFASDFEVSDVTQRHFLAVPNAHASV
jgi:hypothetical protein